MICGLQSEITSAVSTPARWGQAAAATAVQEKMHLPFPVGG
jgi:hypothetical protein